MLVFPNSKINLGLNILEKRTDGYHNIETVFYPVRLSDALEIIIARDGIFEFNQTGSLIEGDKEDNLCVRAYRLLEEGYNLPPVKIHLHKVIPVGAGLGGGSSDAAFSVMLLNKLFSLGLTDAGMANFTRQLGSDCTFFIKNRPVIASGKGDEFEPCSIDLSSRTILIVVPQIRISTAEAYSKVVPSNSVRPLRDTILKPIDQWKDAVQNDFEPSVFERCPEILKIKQQLYDMGAVYASMSGSGSAVYGIFEKKEIPSVSFPGCFAWQQ
jgi:4-diphosphocytidyl-2-C-methyl-D-erythritol kinase